jgi:hypothetical protein
MAVAGREFTRMAEWETIDFLYHSLTGVPGNTLILLSRTRSKQRHPGLADSREYADQRRGQGSHGRVCKST